MAAPTRPRFIHEFCIGNHQQKDSNPVEQSRITPREFPNTSNPLGRLGFGPSKAFPEVPDCRRQVLPQGTTGNPPPPGPSNKYPRISTGGRMQISDTGLKATMTHEGFRKTAYRDSAGLWTIGVGHLIRPTETHLISSWLVDAEVRDILREDVRAAEAAVNRLVKVPLTQGQFDALVSFTFNVGAGALARSGLLRAVNAGRFQDVPGEFRKWNKAGGRVVKGLVNRREAEITLWGSPASPAG